MAHVGRFYRLANRRDLCIANNDHAYSFSHEYVAGHSIISEGAPGASFSYSNKILSIVGDAWSSELKWESELWNQEGSDWQLSIQIKEFDFAPQLVRLWMVLMKDDHQSAAFWNVNNAVGRASAITWRLGEAFAAEWNADDWPSRPRLLTGAAFALEWP